MSFEDFQRENARREAEAARAATGSKTADIEADHAHEARHRRWVRTKHGRRSRVPIWGVSAGSWAVLLLCLVWFIVLGVLVETQGPANAEARGCASVGALLLAIILGPLTWRLMGPQARDALRWLVRLLPLVVIAAAGVGVWLKGGLDPASSSSSSSSSSSVAVADPARKGGTPDPQHDPQRAALEGEDLAAGLAVAEKLAGASADLRLRLEYARRGVGGQAPLAELLAAQERQRALAPSLRSFAARHTEALRSKAPRSRGATFALGFAPATPAVVEALARPLARTAAPEQRVGLDALTTLASSPAAMPVVLSAARPALGDNAPGSLWAAWLQARLPGEPADPCSALGHAVVSTDAPTRRIAEAALAELSPRCAAAAPVIVARLDELLSAARTRALSNDEEWVFSAGFAALGRTGMASYAQIVRVASAMAALPRSPGHTRPGEVLDHLFEDHYVHAVGVSPLIYERPVDLKGVARPEVVVGPCTAEQLGVTAAALAARPEVRPCLLEVRGAPIAARSP